MVVQDVPVAMPALDETAVQSLRERLRGELLQPGMPGYDQARQMYNAMVDRHPALIVRVAGVADVIASLRFAREHGLPMSVKGGGHGVAGKALCDGGLVIDLAPMQGVRVDPARRTARAEGGVTWGAFDLETQAFGLATTGGVIPSTGIAGLTLGGGLGMLMRRFGLACDNLLSTDMVTADGALLTASETEHPDLFWALRGGSGNFGVVTSFEYRLHPVGPMMLGGFIVHPLSQAQEAARFYRDYVATAPDELGSYFGFATFPDGQQVAAMVVGYSGSMAEGERVLQPMRSFGQPIMDTVGPVPYVQVQEFFSPSYPSGRRNYWKSSFVRELGDGAIAVLIDRFAAAPSPFTGIGLEHLGGAIARVAPDATAFHQRNAPYTVVIAAMWEEAAETEANIQWARESWDALRPWMEESVYVNYLDAGEDGRVREAFGANYARLAAVKAKYDPENVFRSNHNVLPLS
jgi:FAD/FMN-containing dehydrogenase